VPAATPAANFNNQLAGGKQTVSTGSKFDPVTMKNTSGTPVGDKVQGGVPSATTPAAPTVKRNPNNPDDLGFGFDVDTGLPLKSQAEKDANTAKADAAEKAAAAPARTGGKVAGQVSNTPNAVRKRAARAAGKAQPSAFGNMASQLTKNNSESYETTLASKIAEHKATNTVTESRSIFTK
jgi:hypothetical protein